MKTTRLVAKITVGLLAGMMVMAFAGCSGKKSKDADKKIDLKNVKPAPESDFDYKLTSDEEGVIITGYNTEANRKNLVIPSAIQGLPVVGIEKMYPYGAEALVIPEGCKWLAPNCFNSIDKLETVVLPESLMFIGRDAFYGDKKIRSITIPNGVVLDRNGSFDYLKEINLPEEIISNGGRVKSLSECIDGNGEFREVAEKVKNFKTKKISKEEYVALYEELKSYGCFGMNYFGY